MKNMIATTLCLGAMLGMVSSAQAITYDFNVLQTSIIPAGGTGITGWNVKMNSVDNITWNVTSVSALGGIATPTNAQTIQFSFFDGLGITGNLINGTAGGTGSVAASAWAYDNNPGVRYDAAGGATVLAANGSNSFSGGFTLANGSAKSLLVNIQGQTGQWQGIVSPLGLTPEMPGSALLLVALLPLGLVVRKHMGNA